MARFDVYANEDANGYLLDIQADLLNNLNTRIVVPLMKPQNAPTPAKRLNPVFEINGGHVIMATQFMAAVPLTILKQPVATLEQNHREIIDAVDFLMQGF
ncbi:MAG: CcdB family protein [Rhodospirillales bacterium]|nr:CcdB family protein [Rhodospirillales bacterium]